MGIFEAPGRVSGKTYKLKIKGDTPSETEQARIRAFVDEQENAFAANYEASYGAPLAVDDGTALGRGWEMGKAGAFSRLGTATEYLGSGLGLESLVNVGKGMQDSGEQEAFLESLRQPAPTELKDVTGLGSALTYLGEGIGQSGPEMLAPLVAGAAGTLTAGPLAGLGASAATAFPSFFGGNIQRQEGEVAAGRKAEVDVSDAIVSAVGQSALNAIGDKLLLGGFLKPGQKWLTRSVIGVAEGAATEIPTEIAQQIIERKQAGLPLDDDEAISEYINAGILGGVMGGGVRGATAALGIGMGGEAPPAGTPPAVSPTPTITPDEDISPGDAQAAADEISGFDEAPTEAEVPEAAPTPINVPTIGDSRIDAGVSVDEDLVEARAIYDERLSIAEEGGADTAEAQRIAAESTLNYIDSLDDGAKQRLSRFRSIMARAATAPTTPTPKTGDVMPPEAPPSAYAAEFEASPQGDLFAAPSARKIAEAEAEADARVAAPEPPTVEAFETEEQVFDRAARLAVPEAKYRKAAEVAAPRGVDVSGVDEAISQGVGNIRVVEDGQPVPFEKFALSVDGGKAEVGFVERAKGARKGIGYAAYVALGEKLAQRGVRLQSSQTKLGPGQNLWKKLEQNGYAKLNPESKRLEFVPQGARVPAAPTPEARTAPKTAEAPKPEQVLTDDLVTELGVGPAKSAPLRRLVGKPLTDSAVIRTLDSWAQKDFTTPEQKALAGRLITGQPAPEAPAIAPTQEAPNVPQTAAVESEEVGAGAPSGGPSVEDSGRPADDTASPAGVEAPASGGLGGSVPVPMGSAAAERVQPDTLIEAPNLRTSVIPQPTLRQEPGMDIVQGGQVIPAPVQVPQAQTMSPAQRATMQQLDQALATRYERMTPPDVKRGAKFLNEPGVQATTPDKLTLTDKQTIINLLATRDDLLSPRAKAAKLYFSKVVRPMEAVLMIVDDLSAPYGKYRAEPGTPAATRAFLAETGSVAAKQAIEFIQTRMSPELNREVAFRQDLSAQQNKNIETWVADLDRVELKRAERLRERAARAEAAEESGYGPAEVAAKMSAADPLVALDQSLHYSVKYALDAGDLKGALQALAATTHNADLKALASRFADLTGTTRVKVLYPGDSARHIGRNRGIYWQTRANGDPERQNIIYLNGQTGMSAHALMHEMAHAVTANFVDAKPNHPLVKQLESLLSSLRDAAPKGGLYVNGFYGLRDVKEMIAETYGRVTFGEVDNGLRDLMKRTTFTTYTPTTKELPLNNWERFKEIAGNILRTLVGRPTKPYPRRTVGSTIYGKETGLDRFHRLVDGLLSEAPQVLPDAVLGQAVGNPLTAITTLNNAIRSAPVWDAAGRTRLADLMMSSVPMWLRRALMAPMQLEWFNDLAGSYFPQIAALKNVDDRRRGNIRRLEQAAAPVITQLAKYAETNPGPYSELMSIMGTATRLEVDPTKPQNTYAADPEKLRVWHDLNRQLRLSDTTGKMRDLFKTTRALFESYRNELLDVLRTRVRELTDDTAMQNQIYQRLVDKLDADGVIDPYFSLMRQGDFWLVYTAEDNTAAPVAVDPLGNAQRPTTQYVQSFTSAWARNAFRAKLEAARDANGQRVAWDIKEDRRPKITRALKGYVPPDFVQGAINIIDSTVPRGTQDRAAEQRAAAAREAIEDLFLSFLPEQSIMKSFSKRKGVRGFIGDITPLGVVDRPQDMISVLETKSHAIAFQLSNMKYGSEVQRLMSQADETLKQLKQSGLTPGESVAVEAYYDEFIDRASYAKSPTVSDAAQLLRGVTFGFTLGGSIAGAANNLMQIVMVAMPELAARYGGMRAVTRELRFAKNALTHAGKTQKVLSYGPDGRAVRELTSIDNYGSIANYMEPTVTTDPTTGEERFGYKLRDDMNIPPGLRNKLADLDVLVEVLANNDMLGGSTNQELLESTSNAWRKINRVSGFLMHHTERFNRQITAVAAYNLELGKLVAAGATPDYETKLAAAKRAVELTERVNGSIGAAQAPRIAFGSIGSVVMMYKRFGLHMTRYIINTANMALRGASAEDRAVARYQIIGVIGAAALFSGVQGLPFFGEVMSLFEAFFTDDDDEPPRVVIQKFLGEPYYNGALNYLLGIEVASRISLSGLIFRENRMDKDQSALYDLFEMLGGPAVGVAMNLERGAELLSSGETYRGVEAMMPSAIKNFMKAGRFGTEGATTLRGDEIVPISGLDIVKQAIGYTPEAYARQQERTSVTKRMDEAVREKKRKLLRKYNIAIEDGDFAAVRDILKEMQEFSRKYPEDEITGATLTRSLRGFRQRSEEMIGGVSFGRPERAQREIEEFDPDTTLWADVFK